MSANRLIDFTKTGKKIFGALANYNEFLQEKKMTVPSEPAFFIKPTSAYVVEGQDIEIPKGHVVNEEVELGVIIGKTCKNVSEVQARNYIGGYCLALDMSDMTLIAEAQKKGFPWTFGKGFDTACPVSRFVYPEELPNADSANIFCKVNGKMVQNSYTYDLVFTIPQLIAHISKFVTLEPGDLILTGTPPGVIAVNSGDIIEAGLENILVMKFHVK